MKMHGALGNDCNPILQRMEVNFSNQCLGLRFKLYSVFRSSQYVLGFLYGFPDGSGRLEGLVSPQYGGVARSQVSRWAK